MLPHKDRATIGPDSLDNIDKEGANPFSPGCYGCTACNAWQMDANPALGIPASLTERAS